MSLSSLTTNPSLYPQEDDIRRLWGVSTDFSASLSHAKQSAFWEARPSKHNPMNLFLASSILSLCVAILGSQLGHPGDRLIFWWNGESEWGQGLEALPSCIRSGGYFHISGPAGDIGGGGAVSPPKNIFIGCAHALQLCQEQFSLDHDISTGHWLDTW
jgi:hypothetical protein